MRVSVILFLMASLSANAANWFVTQSGAGAANGTSSGNAWSVANYNASSSPGAGDTVTFTGTITSTVTPNTSGGSGNLLKLDFTGATLTSGNPGINVNGKSHLWLLGGDFGSANKTMVTGNNASATDVTIDGWVFTGSTSSSASLCDGHNISFLTITNCSLTNSTIFWTDSNLNHDITIINNAGLSPTLNLTDQTDLISMGDATNVVIQGNLLRQRTPGNNVTRHNDCIQCYSKGGGNSGTPSGWVIRYNRIEMEVASGSGDNSWLMLENMGQINGLDACKIYGNVFIGLETGGFGNNGMAPNSNDSGAVFRFYNNTVIRHNGPDNTSRFLSPGNLYSRNNILEADSGESGTFLSWTMSVGATWDYNYFFNFGSPSSTFTGTHGASNTDPKFTDYTGNDLSLQSSSPCKATGDSSIGSEYNQGPVTGATWPNPTLATRSSWDIGAFVFSADTTPPTLVSATIPAAGNAINLVFSEAVNIGAGGSGGVTFGMSGGAVTATYSSGSGSSTLVYTLSRTVLSGETKSSGLDYTQPGNGIEDASGNDLATLTGATVTNNSSASGGGGATGPSVSLGKATLGKFTTQ